MLVSRSLHPPPLCTLHLTGLPASAAPASCPTHPAGAGRQRRSSVTFQGRFRQPLPYEGVVTGQELLRPAKNLPARWLVNTVLIRVRLARACGQACAAAPALPRR